MYNCCEHMLHYVERGKEVYSDKSMRCIAIKLEDDTHPFYQEIWYCPWCGKKLPVDLSLKWLEVLRDEYGLKDPNFHDKEQVPPEFHTDEWWKKRGL